MQAPGAERHRHKEDRGNARRFPGNRQVQPNPRRGMRRFARPARYCKASARRFGTSQDAHDLLSMAIIPRAGAFVKCRFHILTHSSSYAGGNVASAAGLCRLSITPVCRGKNPDYARILCVPGHNSPYAGERNGRTAARFPPPYLGRSRKEHAGGRTAAGYSKRSPSPQNPPRAFIFPSLHTAQPRAR